MSNYHDRIVDYYRETENHYRVYWALDKTLAIHYGYWDEKVKSFPQSLLRMNEVLAETAKIQKTDRVLDAGCGVGGSSIFLAQHIGCHATGITLSAKQVARAFENAKDKNVSDRTDFKVMNYCKTDFPDASFDVVWGCESICYADSKEQFVREAFRLLKPGGRLILADFMVPAFENNQDPSVRRWLDGWVVNFLETPDNFKKYMLEAGFEDVRFRDISTNTLHSTKRLGRLYYWGKVYLAYCKIIGKTMDPIRLRNIKSAYDQYQSHRRALWIYGMFCTTKPS